METKFLTGSGLPFCKGCGHITIASNTETALQKCGFNPLDVVLVTDIGCHGIIDKNFLTHTIHGLHGRSVALAAGVSAGLNNPDKKVIVFIGDGGATIGMQHLIDAAHNNFNMTVVIHNNMLYGMTGGQPSEFTPLGFKTPTLTEGAQHHGLDICSLVAAAGAHYVERITGIGDISEHLANAFKRKGFSLVEVLEICPSYGVKSNPGMKLRELAENAGLEVKVFADKSSDGYKTNYKHELPDLLDKKIIISQNFNYTLKRPKKIMLCGSAGEGVQSAAELFARAAISAGLHVTKKGSYPVTVGIGFSASDIILSPGEILFTGSTGPDYVVVTSQDGLDYAKTVIGRLDEKSVLCIDEELPLPETKAKVARIAFRQKAGARSASFYALLYLLMKDEIFPVEAFTTLLKQSKAGEKMDLNKLLEMED